MGLGEADTRAKLLDPVLHARRWSEDLVRRGPSKRTSLERSREGRRPEGRDGS
jgi:type I restriction enzyme R subunit